MKGGFILGGEVTGFTGIVDFRDSPQLLRCRTQNMKKGVGKLQSIAAQNRTETLQGRRSALQATSS